jgi:XTP/dITP diphosphohydrolase
MRLVFATHNKNKFEEIENLLPNHIQLLSLDDIGCIEDIEETGKTIDENAIIKAKYVKEKYHYNCFADDTGLEVDELGQEPGVYSARYAGEEKDNEANMAKVLRKLEGKKNRRARFKTVIALTLDDHQSLFTGVCDGEILQNKKGERGFGYDPIFKPNGHQKSFGEMTMEEKGKLSHRGKAFQQLVDYLKK